MNETHGTTITLTPIGVLRTPFRDQPGTPIQSTYGDAVVGRAVLEPPYVAALADLDGFDRVWLVYAFHRSRPWQPRVVPYRDTVERGLFATRAPSRPNPIGLSCVRLLRVENRALVFAGADMLDGTPLLDVKPYVPSFDAFPDARAGWLDEARARREHADDRFRK